MHVLQIWYILSKLCHVCMAVLRRRYLDVGVKEGKDASGAKP